MIIYDNISPAKFLERTNRFVARIEHDGTEKNCHVKNTGRCHELFLPGAQIYVQSTNNTARKTGYDLIAVEKDGRIINVDSQVPNKVFADWIKKTGYLGGVSLLKPESFFGNSRFDFYIETDRRKIYVEVKGVTLEREGAAMFPDAPTQRGIKHLEQLINCVKSGYEAMCVFIIQMKGSRYFTINIDTHPAFGETLKKAIAGGVEVIALECDVTPCQIEARDFIKVAL